MSYDCKFNVYPCTLGTTHVRVTPGKGGCKCGRQYTQQVLSAFATIMPPLFCLISDGIQLTYNTWPQTSRPGLVSNNCGHEVFSM